MSKRNWLNGFAYGIVAGFLLTPALIFAAILFGVSPSDFGESDDYPYGSEQTGPEDDRWWLIPRIVYMDDTAAQWVMMFATIFAAYLLLRTLWATQQMVADTRDVGEAQVRAYLGVVGIEPQKIEVINQRAPSHAAFRLNAELKNSGQSPAFICRRYSRILISKKILEKIDIREEAWVKASMRIPAGGKFRLEAEKPWSDVDAAIAEGCYIYLFCGVEYEDVFFREGRKPHVDHFCFLVDFNGPLGSPEGAVEDLPKIEWRDALVKINPIGNG